MSTHHHDPGHHHREDAGQVGHHAHATGTSVARTAALATLHCLTGCAIGEILGMVIGTAFAFSNTATIVLAIVLAFFFGYSLTVLPLFRSGLAVALVLPLALASDTFSISVMEVVDNVVMVAVPGAMDAGLSDFLFWGSLALALTVAFFAAWPVNRYLIGRGLGHAVVHEFHHGHGSSDAPSHAVPALNAGRLAAVGIGAVAFTVGIGIAGAEIADRGSTDRSHAARGGGEAMGGMSTREGAHGQLTHDRRASRDASSGLSATANGYRLELLTRNRLAPGRHRLGLTVVDEHGEPVRGMDRHGGVRLHLIVVRRDLATFQHVHPTQTRDGGWRVTLRLSETGRYRAFADFTVDGEQTVLGQNLSVGDGSFSARPLPEPRTTDTVSGYRVHLSGRPRARTETEVSFTVTHGNRPAELEPYLGAGGHLVALRQHDLAYLHVHPMKATEHGRIRFMATFPSADKYRLFLQFKDDGYVYTAPFTVDVQT